MNEYQRIICIHRKQNVLSKLVIPKIQKAIAYIKSELEEKEREETFRLKRFKESKMKKMAIIEQEKLDKRLVDQKLEAQKEIIQEPHILVKPPSEINQQTEISDSIPTFEPKQLTELEMNEIESMIEEEDDVEFNTDHFTNLKAESLILAKHVKIKEKKIKETCSCILSEPDYDKETGKFICPICKLASESKDQEIKINVVPCQTCLPDVFEKKDRLDHLMGHINQVIKMTKEYKKKQDAENKVELFSYTIVKKLLEYIPYSLMCTCPQHVAAKIILDTQDSRQTKPSENSEDVCICDITGSDSKCPCDTDQNPDEVCSCPEDLVGDIVPDIGPTVPYLSLRPRTIASAYGYQPMSYSAASTAYMKNLRPCGLPGVSSSALPYPLCLNEMADRIAKASEPYLNRRATKYAFSICQGDAAARIARASVPYFSSIPFKYTTESLSSYGKDFYSKDSAAYYTSAPQRFTLTPLSREGNNVSALSESNLPDVKDSVIHISKNPERYYESFIYEDHSGPSSNIKYKCPHGNISRTVSELDLTAIAKMNEHLKFHPREEKPGTSKISNMNPFSRNSPTYLALISQTPYTREGKPGPCGIPKSVSKEAGSCVSYRQRPSPCAREGNLGPFGIPVFEDTDDLHDASIFKDSGGYVILIAQASTPYTREGQPGPCGIGESNKMTKDIATSAVIKTQRYSPLTPYTREGKPGPCGIIEMDDMAVLPDITVSSISTNRFKVSQVYEPFTRQRKPGPCGIPETKRQKMIEPYTREGKPGPCSIIDPNQSKSLEAFMTEDTSGPSGLSQLRPDLFLPLPYTREGKPGPCNLSPLQRTRSLEAFTREGRPGPCNLLDLEPQFLEPYTREGKPGPSPMSAPKRFTPFEYVTLEGNKEHYSFCPLNIRIPEIKVERYKVEGNAKCSPVCPLTKSNDLPEDLIHIDVATYITKVQHYTPHNRQCQHRTYDIQEQPIDGQPDRKNSIAKTSATYFINLPQDFTPYTANTHKKQAELLVPIPDNLLQSTVSSEYCIPSSSKFSTPYLSCLTSAVHSPDVRSTVSKLSTVYYSSLSSKRSAQHHLSPASSLRSTLTVNYVICQTDIKAAIDKASAPYFPPGTGRHEIISNYAPLLPEIQAKIASASEPYVNPSLTKDLGNKITFEDMGSPFSSGSATYISDYPVYDDSLDETLAAFYGVNSPIVVSTAQYSAPSGRNGTPRSTPDASQPMPPESNWVNSEDNPDDLPPLNVPSDIHDQFEDARSNSDPSITRIFGSCKAPDCFIPIEPINPPEIKPLLIESSALPHLYDTSKPLPAAIPALDTCEGICFVSESIKPEPKISASANPCCSFNTGSPTPKFPICVSCGKIKKYPPPSKIVSPDTSIFSTKNTMTYEPCPNCASTSSGKRNIGYLETEFKEITKIITYKNRDGTITNEKQIITIKTEKKGPPMSQDNERDVGTCIHRSQEYDYKNYPVAKDKNNNDYNVCRDTKSENIVRGSNDVTPCPRIKRCISVQENNKPKYPCILGSTWTTETEIDINECPTKDADSYNEYASKTTSISKLADCQKVGSAQCDYVTVRVVPKSPSGFICGNRPEDTESGPKCSCAEMTTSKPLNPIYPSIYPNLKDLERRLKCCLKENSADKPSSYMSENKTQDTKGDIICSCPDTPPILETCPKCGLKLQKLDNQPKCVCTDELSCKPPMITETENSQKCCGMNKPITKPPSPAYTLKQEEKGHKPICNCTAESTYKPVPSKDLKTRETESSKCCRVDTSSKSLEPLCGNRPQDTESGAKCSCADISTNIPSCPLCALRQEAAEPKCSCTEEQVSKPISSVCQKCITKAKSLPKCCGIQKQVSKPICPICALNLGEEDDNPKCSCRSVIAPPVCLNKDTSPPKSCLSSRSKSSALICGNRSKDTDSGVKCSCADVATSIPACPLCGKLEEANNELKCDCADVMYFKSAISPKIANKMEFIPKCYQATKNKSSSPVKSADPDSGDQCRCIDMSTSISSCPVCGFKKNENDNMPKCSCFPPISLKAKSLSECVCPDVSTPTLTSSTCPLCRLKFGSIRSEPSCKCTEGPCCKPLCANTAMLSKIPIIYLPNKISTYGSKCGLEVKEKGSELKCKCASEGINKPDLSYPNSRDMKNIPKCTSPYKIDMSNTTKSSPICKMPVSANSISNAKTKDSTPDCKCPKCYPKESTCPGQPNLIAEPPKAVTSLERPTGVCCPIQSEPLKYTDMSYSSIFHNAPGQACCKHRQKSNSDTAKCCLSTCPGKINCPDRLKKFEPSKRPEKYDRSTSISGLAAYSKGKNEELTKAKNKDDSDSCCMIKIIAKAPKTRCCDTQNEEIVLKGSVIDVLRKMLLPTKSRTHHREKPIDKNICKACYSPLTDSEENSCSDSCPLCKTCQDKLENESEEGYRCTYYGTDSGSQSLRSTFSGQKHLGKEPEKCFSVPKSIIKANSDGLMKYTDECVKKSSLKKCTSKTWKEASTSTRLSDRYDVRPVKKGKIEHASARTRDFKDCSCHSDSHLRNGRNTFKPKPKSESDDIFKFYRW